MKTGPLGKWYLTTAITILIAQPAFSESIPTGNDNDLAVKAFEDQHYEQAESYFLKTAKQPETRNTALIYLTKIALGRGDFKTAADYIDQALTVAPNDADEILVSADVYCAHAQQASIFKALKLGKKCGQQFEAAADLEPNHIKANESAVRFHLNAPGVVGGSQDKANHYLSKLKSIAPENIKILEVELLDKEGKQDEALKLAESYLKNGFTSARNQYQFALFYKNKALYPQAKSLFEAVAQSPKTEDEKWWVIDSLLQLGEIHYLAQQDYSKSIEYIEQYKTQNSDPYDTNYFWSTWSLAKAYYDANNKTKYKELIAQIKTGNYKKNNHFKKVFESGVKERKS